ncbi:MAG: VWA domain-containing protein [bacterium]|nr:VWA domain-containing protein [bacterium]
MALFKSKESVILSYVWDNPTITKNLPFEEQRFLLVKIRPLELPSLPKVNLILVLDKSASMEGDPLENLKKAVREILQILDDEDHISIILFDSEARVLVSNTPASHRKEIRTRVEDIFPIGGTCIDEGIDLGIQEAEKFRASDVLSWMILLTDGKNEHGDNKRCLDLAREARKKGINISTIGLGRKWDPKLLEEIADLSGGKMYFVENPEDLKERFVKEFQSIKNVAYRDVSLKVRLEKNVRMSEVSPVFLVTPQIKKIEPLWDGIQWIIEIGNIERDKEKLLLFQLFISEPESSYINKIFDYEIEYKTTLGERQTTQTHNVVLEVTESYVSQFNEEVRETLERLSLYIQQELAEQYIDEGKPLEALTIFQTMVQTAVKFESETLKKLVEENIKKIKAEGSLPDEYRIMTKYETKMVEE